MLQYLGNHTTEKVKARCIELLYSWSVGLQHECKVKEAYDMLKHQGIVKADPVHVDKVSSLRYLCDGVDTGDTCVMV